MENLKKLLFETFFEEDRFKYGTKKIFDSAGELRERIIELTAFLPEDVNVKVRIYCVLNNVKELPKCTICFKPHSKFESFEKGFRRSCSKSCATKLGFKTCMERYGVNSNLKIPEVRESIDAKWKERYGGNPLSSEEIRAKARKTCVEKYGVESPGKASQLPQFIKKRENTCLQKYGVKHQFSSEEIQEKSNKTCLKKYGVNSTAEVAKLNATKEKMKATCTKLYGASSFLASEQGKLVRKNTLEIWKEHRFETMRKNKTFNTSKPEERVFESLKAVFPEVIRQYRSEKFPWACDFYIPTEDLYIDFNGHWTHGSEPFNDTNSRHLVKINEWKTKDTKFYENAIYVWSELDVKKRQVAKDNGIKRLEFFTEDSVYNWLKVRKDA